MARQPPGPLRVLIDVTQFGVVQDDRENSVHRAGIHRVVEQTVRSVSAAPGVVLTLCAQERPQAAADFVLQHDDMRHVPFAPARRQLGARLRARVVAEHERHGAHTPTAMPLRAINKVVAVGNQALDSRVGAVDRATVRGADVYHSPVYALPEARARVRRVRYFLTVYDVIPLLFPQFSSWGGEAWIRHILASLGPDDHVLAISEHTRRDLLNACPQIAPEHVRVTPLAADPARFYRCDDAAQVAAVRGRYGVPDAPYVLSVGTLEPRKNIPRLIQSFADLVRSEQVGDLHLVLTGSKGWDYDAIFAEVGRLDGLRERIVFTGYVADADLAALYTGALAFVYPSFYEGFGLPPLEAMQCGTPVITSNTSSLPEVVGDAGVMVDPNDGAALAQAILDLYGDSSRRADLAARATARAAQFTWDRFADQTVGAYRSAL
jgi:glycosyltransferase involved in cell wall biosynthesis